MPDCTALFVHQTSELAQLPREERQAVVEEFARKKYFEGQMEPDGSVLIRTLDLHG
jgi:hypothetical protein